MWPDLGAPMSAPTPHPEEMPPFLRFLPRKSVPRRPQSPKPQALLKMHLILHPVQVTIAGLSAHLSAGPLSPAGEEKGRWPAWVHLARLSRDKNANNPGILQPGSQLRALGAAARPCLLCLDGSSWQKDTVRVDGRRGASAGCPGRGGSDGPGRQERPGPRDPQLGWRAGSRALLCAPTLRVSPSTPSYLPISTHAAEKWKEMCPLGAKRRQRLPVPDPHSAPLWLTAGRSVRPRLGKKVLKDCNVYAGPTMSPAWGSVAESRVWKGPRGQQACPQRPAVPRPHRPNSSAGEGRQLRPAGSYLSLKTLVQGHLLWDPSPAPPSRSRTAQGAALPSGSAHALRLICFPHWPRVCLSSQALGSSGERGDDFCLCPLDCHVHTDT